MRTLQLALAVSGLLVTGVAPVQGAGAGSPLAAGEQALRTRLESAYPGVTQWEIAPLRPVTAGSGVLFTGELAITVTRLGVRSAVWVRPQSPTQHSRGELFWYSVAGYGPAAVATRRLTQGTALDPGDAEVSASDLVAAGCPALVSTGALEGMRTRIAIRAGEVICASAIEPRPPVVRGDEVTVRYRGSAVTLTARAVAQADGLLGKPVLVRSTTSGDIFTATVSGKAEVLVHD